MSAFDWSHCIGQAMEHRKFTLNASTHADVWCLRTEDLHEDAVSSLSETLDRNEKERIQCKGSDESRRNSTLVHGLLRYALGEVAKIAPENVRLHRASPQSKPVLAGPIGRTIDVSLSHCRGLVACAIGWNCSVGVDVETLKRAVTPEWIFFALSDEEQQWIGKKANDRRRVVLLHVWTLKEAVLKADGCGLARDLTSFAVLPDPPRLMRCPPEMGAAVLWQLWQSEIGQDHVLAVACRPSCPVIRRLP